ncbi:amidohydrolase family protein [Pseudonocardia pini]|uniref:amidohydrolase family protein n=1 Tax=Pseudonocardia pini TaxID=2758030 RepID=UPI0028AC50B0|nr:amidohydrolase family protein [Pseudonocardia pini]
MTETPVRPDPTLRATYRDVDTGSFDTRELLANARRQAEERDLDRMLVVDVDAHHYETEAWSEIVTYLEDPVLQHLATAGRHPSLAKTSAFLPTQISGQQDLAGRVSRYTRRHLEKLDAAEESTKSNRTAGLARRAMEMMSIDYQILFPGLMLNLGLHPQKEFEVAVARAYARWLTEKVIPADPGLRTMLYLPFNDPEASLELVKEFADAPGVVGFMVTATRYKAVHDNAYMPLYAELERRGKPLGFHAVFHRADRSFEQLNKFISIHSLGFTFTNMIHLTNWIVNGLPVRFPGLDVVWIESGLAWLPFLMQRLDHEWALRSSETPLLTRAPSTYIREMYFTSQPLETPEDLSILETTFKMINAETQLLYSSDYPHWDFDVPSRIYDLPFLTDQARRNILGLNAARLFGLPTEPRLDPEYLRGGIR